MGPGFLMAPPIVVALFTAVTRPEYFSIFLTTLPGIIMLVMGSIMMLLGYLWARFHRQGGGVAMSSSLLLAIIAGSVQ